MNAEFRPLRRPQRFSECFSRCSDSSSFDSDVGRDVAAAMGKCAGISVAFRVQWLHEIFNHKTSPTHQAEQFFPAMQIFERSFLAMRAASDRRQGAAAMVRLDE